MSLCLIGLRALTLFLLFLVMPLGFNQVWCLLTTVNLCPSLYFSCHYSGLFPKPVPYFCFLHHLTGLKRHIYIISAPGFPFADLNHRYPAYVTISALHTVYFPCNILSAALDSGSKQVNKYGLDSLISSTILPPASSIFFTATVLM